MGNQESAEAGMQTAADGDALFKVLLRASCCTSSTHARDSGRQHAARSCASFSPLGNVLLDEGGLTFMHSWRALQAPSIARPLRSATARRSQIKARQVPSRLSAVSEPGLRLPHPGTRPLCVILPTADATSVSQQFRLDACNRVAYTGRCRPGPVHLQRQQLIWQVALPAATQQESSPATRAMYCRHGSCPIASRQ
jgi:hypothetical protein